MKKIKILNILLPIFAFAIISGCNDDFIDRLPKDTIVDANFYRTSDQVLAGSAPLYNIVWFAYNDKASHGIGDGRGGILSSNYSYQLENIQFRTTPVTGENVTSWKAFYNVVGQANTLINNLQQFVGPDVPDEITNHAIAEARVMRGLAYQYLVMNWGPVPVFTDNIEASKNDDLRRNTIESVWEFIIRDLRFGAEYLPETPIMTGRLTKYSAEGLLAKAYLIKAGVGSSGGSRNQVYLDSAKYFAKDVIDNGGYALMEDYEDLFKSANNNNEETLFALQWVFEGSDWGVQNSVQAFLAFSSAITGFSDGWGGDTGGSMYILDKYEGLVEDGQTPDERLRATFMMPGDHYDYIHQSVLDDDGNPFVQELIVPTGGSGYNERAWIKKYVVGRPEDNDGRVRQQRTDMQTYMLRLADVYLVYAEAILGNNASTNDTEALKYFNEVRGRAGLDPKTNITFNDILDERLVEFAMEGQAWYEFVKLHYYNPELAYTMLSNQNRGFIRITPVEYEQRQIEGELKDVAIRWTIEDDPNYSGKKYFDVNSGNFLIPLPEAEVSQAPNLKKEPVPYEF